MTKDLVKEVAKSLRRWDVKFESESGVGGDADGLSSLPTLPSLIREGVPLLLTDLGDLRHDRHSEAAESGDPSLTLRMTVAEESHKLYKTPHPHSYGYSPTTASSPVGRGVAPTLLKDFDDLHHDSHSEAEKHGDFSLTLRMTPAEESPLKIFNFQFSIFHLKNSPFSILNFKTHFQFNKAAFTLAEVLITLAVIGVVAAITMPVLINNINEKHFITAWKKGFAEVSNAALMLKSEDYALDRDNLEVSLVEGLAKYIKHTKFCAANRFVEDGCAPENYSVYSYDNNFLINNIGKLGGGATCFLSVNGSIICLDSFIVYIDVNGYKRPNTIGKDIFAALIDTNTYTVRPAKGYSPQGGPSYNLDNLTSGDGTCQTADRGFGCSFEKLYK